MHLTANMYQCCAFLDLFIDISLVRSRPCHQLQEDDALVQWVRRNPGLKSQGKDIWMRAVTAKVTGHSWRLACKLISRNNLPHPQLQNAQVWQVPCPFQYVFHVWTCNGTAFAPSLMLTDYLRQSMQMLGCLGFFLSVWISCENLRHSIFPARPAQSELLKGYETMSLLITFKYLAGDFSIRIITLSKFHHVSLRVGHSLSMYD